MALGPIKVAIQVAKKVVTDENTRNKISYILMGGLAGLVVIVMIPIYILTHPIEMLKTLFQDEQQVTQIEDFKTENDVKILQMGSNIMWNEGAICPMPGNGTITKQYIEQNEKGETMQNTGIEISLTSGAEIIAIAEGFIEKINQDSSVFVKFYIGEKILYGYYEKLSEIILFEGQAVKMNAVIGYSGDIIHFELRENMEQASHVNPCDYLCKKEEVPNSEIEI